MRVAKLTLSDLISAPHSLHLIFMESPFLPDAPVQRKSFVPDIDSSVRRSAKKSSGFPPEPPMRIIENARGITPGVSYPMK
jgi:hypothetical protein